MSVPNAINSSNPLGDYNQNIENEIEDEDNEGNEDEEYGLENEVLVLMGENVGEFEVLEDIVLGAGDGPDVPTLDEINDDDNDDDTDDESEEELDNAVQDQEPDVNIFDAHVSEHDLQMFDSPGWKHFETVIVYMLMHCLIFFSILSFGHTILQLFAILSRRSDIFLSPFTYFVGFLFLAIVRIGIDFCEYYHVSPSYDTDMAGSRVWKHVPFLGAVGLCLLAYMTVLKGYRHKFEILDSGARYRPEDSGWYFLSLAYIVYFTTSVCLMDSRRTSFLKQVVQGGVSVTLGAAANKLGGHCAFLLLFDSKSYPCIVTGLTVSILFLSICFVELYHRLLETVPRKHGSNVVELVWAFLSCYKLAQVFLTLQGPPNQELNSFAFYGAIAFSMSNTAKLALSHYWIEEPRPSPIPFL